MTATRTIAPADVLALMMTGVLTDGPDEYVALCEEVPIAHVVAGRVAHMACPAPTHGAHPRIAAQLHSLLGNRVSRYEELMARFRLRNPCADCNEVGWLPPTHPAIGRAVALAIHVGTYRGIALPLGDLPQAERVQRAINGFLAWSGAFTPEGTHGPT